MVRKTSVTFYRPKDYKDDTRAKHTDNEPEEVATVRGALLHRTMTKMQTELGVGDANNWTYLGWLPTGSTPTTRWTAKAFAEGRERTFRVSGSAQGLGDWQIALQET